MTELGPASSATQPRGVPGTAVLIILKVPPYLGPAGVGLGIAVVVGCDAVVVLTIDGMVEEVTGSEVGDDVGGKLGDKT